MGLYGIIHKAFDSYGWRLLSPIPNLNGTWVGHVKSSHEADKQSRVVVTIQQTWTHARICLESEWSRSHSLMAAIRTDEEGAGLSYEFLNEPKAVVAAPTMQAHRGTATLQACSAAPAVKPTHAGSSSCHTRFAPRKDIVAHPLDEASPPQKPCDSDNSTTARGCDLRQGNPFPGRPGAAAGPSVQAIAASPAPRAVGRSRSQATESPKRQSPSLPVAPSVRRSLAHPQRAPAEENQDGDTY